MDRHIFALLKFLTLLHRDKHPFFYINSPPPPPKPTVSFLCQTDYHNRISYNLYLHLGVNIYRCVLQKLFYQTFVSTLTHISFRLGSTGKNLKT